MPEQERPRVEHLLGQFDHYFVAIDSTLGIQTMAAGSVASASQLRPRGRALDYLVSIAVICLFFTMPIVGVTLVA